MFYDYDDYVLWIWFTLIICLEHQPKGPHNCLGFYSEVCQHLLVCEGIALIKANTKYIEVSLKKEQLRN